MSGSVSVIIPTFNRGRVLGEAVESVLAQVHGDLEVIVVDDGSSDGTRDLLTGLMGADARVHYQYQGNAGAASGAWHTPYVRIPRPTFRRGCRGRSRQACAATGDSTRGWFVRLA